MRVTTEISNQQVIITPRVLRGWSALLEVNRVFETVKPLPQVEQIVIDLRHIDEIDFSVTHLLQRWHEKSHAQAKRLTLVNCQRPIRQMLCFSLPRRVFALTLR